MSKAGEAKIAASTDDFTKVTFKPDLPKFGMDCLNRDMVALLTRRVYDLAGCLTGVKVYLNGKRIPVSEALGLLVGCDVQFFLEGWAGVGVENWYYIH